MLERYRLDGKSKVSVQDFNPSDTAGFESKEQVAAEFEKLKEELVDIQERLYAGKTHGVLIIFQGMDCSGKDGVVKKVLAGLNPQGVRAESFKQPTSDEAAHDFLWRTHKLTPAKGLIASFNRSYYEDVLITRVHGTIDKKETAKRLKHIHAFEKLLCDDNTVVIKLFLHISPEFQLEKINERMKNPEKLWKFDPSDLQERKYWDSYIKAYEDAFKATSTKTQPWYIVPANHRWFRDFLVLKIIVSTLKKLELEYPKVDLERFTSLGHAAPSSDSANKN